MKQHIHYTLQQAWLKRGWLAVLLLPLSGLYGALAWVHRHLYQLGILKTQRVAVPVVVVGNIVAGGGGKTPTVIALVQHLKAKGWHVGVVSRGYGRSDNDCREVLPHSGMGNGWLLPAGPLREKLRNTRLREQNNLVLHTGNHPVKIATTAPQFTAKRSLAQKARRHDGGRVNLADLNEMASIANKPLLALAGIANPESFFAMLRDLGLQLSKTIALPDHYAFDSVLGNEYAGYSLICTDKDAVKLWQTAPQALAVGLEFVPEPAFFTEVDQLLAGLKSSTSFKHHQS